MIALPQWGVFFTAILTIHWSPRQELNPYHLITKQT